MGRCAILPIIAMCMNLLTSVFCTGDQYLILTEGPADQVFVESSGRENVTFACTTDGNPEPEIVWMKNDVPVEENVKYQITDEGALVINGPVREDHGDRFRCEARNAFGALRSRNATLEIAYVDRAPNPGETDVRMNSRNGGCFDCSLPNAHPGIHVKWETETADIDPDGRTMVLADGRMCFAFTTTSDDGQYSCFVTNSYAYDQGLRLAFKLSTVVNLEISEGRRDQQLVEVDVPDNVTVKRGEEAVLQCIFLGKPAPILRWTTDRTLDTSIATDGYQLRIPNAQPHHTGEYRCTATKDDMTTMTTQYLTVISPPILTSGLDDTQKGAQSSVEFRCESDDPSDEYAWYYNAEPIEFDSRIQRQSSNAIFLKRAVVSDSGIYQCSVSNRFGEVFSTAQLKIHDSEDDGAPDQKKSGGNSSAMLTGSTMLLTIVMIYQKVL